MFEPRTYDEVPNSGKSRLRPELSVVWSCRRQTSAGRSWVIVKVVIPTGKDVGA